MTGEQQSRPSPSSLRVGRGCWIKQGRSVFAPPALFSCSQPLHYLLTGWLQLSDCGDSRWFPLTTPRAALGIRRRLWVFGGRWLLAGLRFRARMPNGWDLTRNAAKYIGAFLDIIKVQCNTLYEVLGLWAWAAALRLWHIQIFQSTLCITTFQWTRPSVYSLVQNIEFSSSCMKWRLVGPPPRAW